MKKVLVTGGCGYIGARLSKYLAENGYRVFVFDTFKPAGYKQWTSLMEEVYIGDIRDESAISRITSKYYDAVIHLISLDHHKSEDNPAYVSSINVTPTWNLLDKFTKKGLKKFIYFSTIHVYGKIPAKNTTEDHPPSPGNAYTLTHLLSENICSYFNRNTDTRCLNVRLSNSYGSPVFKENNCWWLVINDLCKTAFDQKKIQLLSDGSPQRDFIHSTDVCRAVEILIEAGNDALHGDHYHIASGNTLTILELAHQVKNVFEKRYQTELAIYLPESAVSNDLSQANKTGRFAVDIDKMKTLGFQPQTDLNTGINELFDFLEENHNAY